MTYGFKKLLSLLCLSGVLSAAVVGCMGNSDAPTTQNAVVSGVDGASVS
jgi:hypothetical protein